MAKNVSLAHVYTEKQLKTARTEVRTRAVLFTREHEANEWNRLIFMLPCCNIVFTKSESLLIAVFLQLNGCMYRLDVSLNFSRWQHVLLVEVDIIYIKQMGNKCLSIGNESHLSKAFYRREKINLNSFYQWTHSMPRNRSLFSCKQPPQIDIRGWVASHVGLWQKAILHHLICSSHANKSEAEWNKTESTSPPPHYTAHTRSLFAYGKRITTTPLCLLVSLMGEAGEHHSPPALSKC